MTRVYFKYYEMEGGIVREKFQTAHVLEVYESGSMRVEYLGPGSPKYQFRVLQEEEILYYPC
jgi:hypothetical protein